jgi:hypothetical protein
LTYNFISAFSQNKFGLYDFKNYIWYQAYAIGNKRSLKGKEVKFNRIVLQTLTFTPGALGIAPANHGSILLSDSRHGIKNPSP